MEKMLKRNIAVIHYKVKFSHMKSMKISREFYWNFNKITLNILTINNCTRFGNSTLWFNCAFVSSSIVQINIWKFQNITVLLHIRSERRFSFVDSFPSECWNGWISSHETGQIKVFALGRSIQIKGKRRFQWFWHRIVIGIWQRIVLLKWQVVKFRFGW